MLSDLELAKKEYIVRQLGRTNGKRFEGYCVQRIYHRLNRPDIQIVTQQMFKRGNGKIALLDLYFPQLRIGVEIDEEYHNDNVESDIAREQEVNAMINAKKNHFESVENGSGIDFQRIDAGNDKDLNDIDIRIDSVIEYIEQKIKETPDLKEWEVLEKPVEVYIKQGYIDANDDVRIKYIKDILKLFNIERADVRSGYIPIDKNKTIFLWAPLLKIEDDEFAKHQFENTIDDGDAQYIYESRKKRPYHFFKEAFENPDIKRIAFPKFIDGLGNATHKFLGVYELDAEKSRELKKRVWKKTAERIDLRDFRWW